MKKLHINFMRRLKNNEFAILIDNINSSVCDEVTDNNVLQSIIEKINFHNDELAFLRDAPCGHPLTKKIEKLTYTRNEYLQSLRMQVKGKMLSHIKEERTAAEYLYWWIEKYKENLYVPSISTQTQLVHGMRNERRYNKDINEAAEVLVLTGLLDAIEKVTNTIVATERKRVKDTTKNIKKGKDLRSAAYADVQLLVSMIEVMFSMHPERDFQENTYFRLMQLLGTNLKDSHTVLKSRQTKQKNKKEADVAVIELIESDKVATQKNVLMEEVTEDVNTNGPISEAKSKNEYSELSPRIETLNTDIYKKGDDGTIPPFSNN